MPDPLAVHESESPVDSGNAHRRLQAHGLTTAEVARRYRVGEDKVRAWIARGELAAVNAATVLCGKPRWVIPPEALVAFERRRAWSS